MNIGYGFWGFLGDKKYRLEEGRTVETSTPDGNAFYSWSIIEELQLRGHQVYQLMPDRDEPGFKLLGSKLFSSWAEQSRLNAYVGMGSMDEALAIIKNLDFVLWEWRWLIPGRNDQATKTNNPSAFQPDYELQDMWLKLLRENNVPVFVFDLDYKLTQEDIMKYNITGVVELGNKWKSTGLCMAKRVQIPFNFRHIHTFEITPATEGVIYVGNRYERDWCVDKYIPDGTIVHGNWLESKRDSEVRWPKLIFRDRLQTADMHGAYSKAAVTPLLAKQDYCQQGFMTARIIEAVFYGCAPLFIEEFKDNDKYLPKQFKKYLLVRNKEDVQAIAKKLLDEPALRKEIIYSLRYHLSSFMSAKHFVDNLFCMVREVH